MSDQLVQNIIPTQADANLELVHHPDSNSISISSLDGDNANNDFFRLQRRRFGGVYSPASRIFQSNVNDPIQLDTSNNDGGDIVNALVRANEREVSSILEEGIKSPNIVSTLPYDSSPSSTITVTPPPLQQPPPLSVPIAPTPT